MFACRAVSLRVCSLCLPSITTYGVQAFTAQTLSWATSSDRRAGVVHFIGGALLGTFPQVAYDELLKRVSEYGSMLVIATPYDLDLNHAGAAPATSPTPQSQLTMFLPSISASDFVASLNADQKLLWRAANDLIERFRKCSAPTLDPPLAFPSTASATPWAPSFRSKLTPA
jgi:hypothetical protein